MTSISTEARRTRRLLLQKLRRTAAATEAAMKNHVVMTLSDRVLLSGKTGRARAQAKLAAKLPAIKWYSTPHRALLGAFLSPTTTAILRPSDPGETQDVIAVRYAY